MPIVVPIAIALIVLVALLVAALGPALGIAQRRASTAEWRAKAAKRCVSAVERRANRVTARRRAA